MNNSIILWDGSELVLGGRVGAKILLNYLEEELEQKQMVEGSR